MDFNTLLIVAVFVAVSITNKNINRKAHKIMATLDERFQAVNDKLDEASKEILAEVEKLRQGGTMTPEQEAALANIETKTSALADISPPVDGEAPAA